MIDLAAAWGLANLPKERSGELIDGFNSKIPDVRCVALESCARGEYRYSILDEIIKHVNDKNAEVRWITARVLQRHSTDESKKQLIKMLDDPNPTVRSMSAIAISTLAKSNTRWVGSFQHEVTDKLRAKFLNYNKNYKGKDADWGWRPVGDALKNCGPRGVESLKKILAETNDKLLADHAWQVIYIKQDGRHFFTETMAEINDDYGYHPKAGEKKPPLPKTVPEPAMMPYIVQDFESDNIKVRTAGDIGDFQSHTGWVRRLGNTLPSAMVIKSDYYGKPGKALQLTKGKPDETCYVDAVRGDYRPDSGMVNIKFNVYLKPESSVVVWFTDSAKWSSTLKLKIEENARLKYNKADNQMTDSGINLPLNTWTKIALTADLDKSVYSIHIGDNAQTVAEQIGFKGSDVYNDLIIMPAGKISNQSLVDDIHITVTNPEGLSKSDQYGTDDLTGTSETESKTEPMPKAMPKIIDNEAANILSPKRSK
jgi:hypothetical protein